ncbi:MAG TPA: hypothetical protein VEW28_04815 [Candidatus Kapabacteria bacterium]|nr:hypothetical protein [Candidatus Kapabacteria bacterium]
MSSKKAYPLHYLERLPKTGSTSRHPVIILLHGRAAKAETIFSIEGLFDPSFHIIAIQAPYSSEKGDFEWFLPYDYERPLESFSEQQFRESETILTEQIQAMMIERSVTADRLFIGGFSQGAAMSHIISLRGNISVRGVLAMSGFFPRPLLYWKLPEIRSSYFISHGTNDKVLSISESKFAYDFYTEHHIDAEFFEYNGRHKMTISLLQKINDWIRTKY